MWDAGRLAGAGSLTRQADSGMHRHRRTKTDMDTEMEAGREGQDKIKFNALRRLSLRGSLGLGLGLVDVQQDDRRLPNPASRISALALGPRPT
jgi:hypothetical protein